MQPWKKVQHGQTPVYVSQTGRVSVYSLKTEQSTTADLWLISVTLTQSKKNNTMVFNCEIITQYHFLKSHILSLLRTHTRTLTLSHTMTNHILAH